MHEFQSWQANLLARRVSISAFVICFAVGALTLSIPAFGADRAVAPLASESNSYLFQADSLVATLDGLTAETGGAPFSSWNPTATAAFLAPGMKVSFFGDPTGCPPYTHLGKTAPVSDVVMSYLTTLTGLAPTDAAALSWTPSGKTAGCTHAVASRRGPTAVYLHASDTDGGLVLYTSAGPRSDGAGKNFFGVFGPGGQDGKGGNANITGNYVAFRTDWRGSAPVRPWLAATGGAGNARIVVNQGVASSQAGTPKSVLTQLQQLIGLHVINKTCLAQRTDIPKQPCQLNYLLHADLERNNVTDWNTQDWSLRVRVWYDGVQGGIPIVEGPVNDVGVSSLERDTGAPLYTSQGSPTQHGKFENLTFDVRVSMDQLQSLLRLLTARSVGVSVGDVTDQQVAAMWGSDWASPQAWVMDSVSVAQEISSANLFKPVWMAGNVRQVYVGDISD